MNWLTSRNILLAIGAVALFTLISLGQEAHRRWQYQLEVQRLEQESKELETKVIELKNLNEYFRTDEYQERLAREKLNYRAEDEKVVLVPQDYEEADMALNDRPNEEGERYSNPELWWRTFFLE